MTYELRRPGQEAARNTEVITVRDGRVTEVEVYFGYAVP